MEEIDVWLTDDEMSLIIERLDTGDEITPFEKELIKKIDIERTMLRSRAGHITY